MPPLDCHSLPLPADDLPLDQITLSRVRDDETLFYLLCSASLVESAAALYTSHLIDYIQPHDATASRWLREQWKTDELEHGRTLRNYVCAVWPSFPWEQAFASFYADYADTYDNYEMESSRALELAARCVAESGTATLYHAIHRYTDEPVLKQLTWRIRNEELRHYRRFRQLFRKFNLVEQRGRGSILLALLRRLVEMRREDADVALRHVLRAHRPSRATAARSDAIARDMRALVRNNLATAISVCMVTGPLTLPPRLARGLRHAISLFTRYFVLR